MSLFVSIILPVLAGVLAGMTISMFAVKLVFRRLSTTGVINMLNIELFLLLFILTGMIGFHVRVTAVYSVGELIILTLVGFVFGCIGCIVVQRKELKKCQNK